MCSHGLKDFDSFSYIKKRFIYWGFTFFYFTLASIKYLFLRFSRVKSLIKFYFWVKTVGFKDERSKIAKNILSYVTSWQLEIISWRQREKFVVQKNSRKSHLSFMKETTVVILINFSSTIFSLSVFQNNKKIILSSVPPVINWLVSNRLYTFYCPSYKFIKLQKESHLPISQF